MLVRSYPRAVGHHSTSAHREAVTFSSAPTTRQPDSADGYQQSVLVVHCLRTGCVEEPTALVNRLRGLLAEFGVFLPQGIDRLHAHFIECLMDGTNELTGTAREALMRGCAEWHALDEEIAWVDRLIVTYARLDPQATRCRDMCGTGALTASAAVATIVDARHSKTAGRWQLGSAPCPDRRAAAESSAWAASRSRTTGIRACCSSLARVLHSIPGPRVTTGSRVGLSNCTPAPLNKQVKASA